MAPPLKDKKVGTLVLIVILGIIFGAYLDIFLSAVLPDGVVKTFFTYAIPLNVGYPAPLSVDLAAVKFHFGFGLRFSLMSIVGVFISLYFFRWYK